MELLAHYEVILQQGLAELGPIKRPRAADKAFEVDALAAPDLGDILYRLCIEHGVSYTPFRETVINILATAAAPPSPSSRSGQARVRPFAGNIEADHALIVLALEMMPPDGPL